MFSKRIKELKKEIEMHKKTIQDYMNLVDYKNGVIKALLQENEELKSSSNATKQ